MSLHLIPIRYKETPNSAEEECLRKLFGFRMEELQDGNVSNEAMDVIHAEFGKDAVLTPSDFHSKSENEKTMKDKELHELGLFI